MYSAIFTRTYPLKSIDSVLDAVVQDGYRGIQANLSSAGLASLPETLPPEIPNQFRSECAKRGLRIAALSGTYNMAHPDPGVRSASRPGFRHVLRAAAEMGAPIVSLCTGSRDPDDMWRFHPENAGREAWSDLLSELEVALAYAGEVGVLLAIEPEPANVVCDAKAAKKLLGELSSPHLGIILDAANLLSAATLARQHEVMAEATDLLGGSLLLAHAKDIDASGNVVSPGDGAVDLIAFARGLRSAGYDGALVAHGFRAEQSAAAWRAIDLVLRGSA